MASESASRRRGSAFCVQDPNEQSRYRDPNSEQAFPARLEGIENAPSHLAIVATETQSPTRYRLLQDWVFNRFSVEWAKTSQLPNHRTNVLIRKLSKTEASSNDWIAQRGLHDATRNPQRRPLPLPGIFTLECHRWSLRSDRGKPLIDHDAQISQYNTRKSMRK